MLIVIFFVLISIVVPSQSLFSNQNDPVLLDSETVLNPVGIKIFSQIEGFDKCSRLAVANHSLFDKKEVPFFVVTNNEVSGATPLQSFREDGTGGVVKISVKGKFTKVSDISVMIEGLEKKEPKFFYVVNADGKKTVDDFKDCTSFWQLNTLFNVTHNKELFLLQPYFKSYLYNFGSGQRLFIKNSEDVFLFEESDEWHNVLSGGKIIKGSPVIIEKDLLIQDSFNVSGLCLRLNNFFSKSSVNLENESAYLRQKRLDQFKRYLGCDYLTGKVLDIKQKPSENFWDCYDSTRVDTPFYFSSGQSVISICRLEGGLCVSTNKQIYFIKDPLVDKFFRSELLEKDLNLLPISQYNVQFFTKIAASKIDNFLFIAAKHQDNSLSIFKIDMTTDILSAEPLNLPFLVLDLAIDARGHLVVIDSEGKVFWADLLKIFENKDFYSSKLAIINIDKKLEDLSTSKTKELALQKESLLQMQIDFKQLGDFENGLVKKLKSLLGKLDAVGLNDQPTIQALLQDIVFGELVILDQIDVFWGLLVSYQVNLSGKDEVFMSLFLEQLTVIIQRFIENIPLFQDCLKLLMRDQIKVDEEDWFLKLNNILFTTFNFVNLLGSKCLHWLSKIKALSAVQDRLVESVSPKINDLLGKEVVVWDKLNEFKKNFMDILTVLNQLFITSGKSDYNLLTKIMVLLQSGKEFCAIFPKFEEDLKLINSQQQEGLKFLVQKMTSLKGEKEKQILELTLLVPEIHSKSKEFFTVCSQWKESSRLLQSWQDGGLPFLDKKDREALTLNSDFLYKNLSVSLVQSFGFIFRQMKDCAQLFDEENFTSISKILEIIPRAVALIDCWLFLLLDSKLPSTSDSLKSQITFEENIGNIVHLLDKIEASVFSIILKCFTSNDIDSIEREKISFWFTSGKLKSSNLTNFKQELVNQKQIINIIRRKFLATMDKQEDLSIFDKELAKNIADKFVVFTKMQKQDAWCVPMQLECKNVLLAESLEILRQEQIVIVDLTKALSQIEKEYFNKQDEVAKFDRIIRKKTELTWQIDDKDIKKNAALKEELKLILDKKDSLTRILSDKKQFMLDLKNQVSGLKVLSEPNDETQFIETSFLEIIKNDQNHLATLLSLLDAQPSVKLGKEAAMLINDMNSELLDIKEKNNKLVQKIKIILDASTQRVDQLTKQIASLSDLIAKKIASNDAVVVAIKNDNDVQKVLFEQLALEDKLFVQGLLAGKAPFNDDVHNLCCLLLAEKNYKLFWETVWQASNYLDELLLNLELEIKGQGKALSLNTDLLRKKNDVILKFENGFYVFNLLKNLDFGLGSTKISPRQAYEKQISAGNQSLVEKVVKNLSTLFGFEEPLIYLRNLYWRSKQQLYSLWWDTLFESDSKTFMAKIEGKSFEMVQSVMLGFSKFKDMEVGIGGFAEYRERTIKRLTLLWTEMAKALNDDQGTPELYLQYRQSLLMRQKEEVLFSQKSLSFLYDASQKMDSGLKKSHIFLSSGNTGIEQASRPVFMLDLKMN